ncbi:hypothetical protein [Chitinasiproducens palmae]|uniref:Uncharacterized protein n=1 Tax=Chitinasiproducens palmae TaxID=1770053 RepID=A0A1H2PLH0_9BURK|nr:hypothetical protein [Chitinasiproducens palmae]SDV47330.1 hypothetical protein SAMN05216551_102487 [Chitinasiproducens palmae]
MTNMNLQAIDTARVKQGGQCKAYQHRARHAARQSARCEAAWQGTGERRQSMTQAIFYVGALACHCASLPTPVQPAIVRPAAAQPMPAATVSRWHEQQDHEFLRFGR